MSIASSFKPIRKAVFPVAGLGTRFLPATKVMPKEMLPINDRPLIQHVYEEARDAGIEEFIFVTGRAKEMLEEHFDYQPELMQTLEERGKEDMLEKVRSSEMPAGKLFLTRQPRPLGLGHAIWCAKKLVGNEPFAILLPDDIIKHPQGCLSQMIDIYNQNGGNVVAVKNVPREDTKKYGILDIESDDGKKVAIKGLVEKPAPEKAPSTLSIIGRYILQPEVFDYLSAFEKGAGNEIQLTDSIAKLIGKQPVHGLRFAGDHYDCGSRLGFIAANLAFGLADEEIGDSVRDILKQFSEKENTPDATRRAASA
jgi:UTP--glucose-1-phosphate uridylyltransferase